MSIDQETDTRDYVVVVNHEEQYSIWFKHREIPNGWREVPIPEAWWAEYRQAHPEADNIHAKDVCLDYIEVIWTDMRPLSLRRAMENAA